METFQDAHRILWQKTLSDIQKIWDKYGIATQGRDDRETVEVCERLIQYRKEIDELKKKYSID